jgi:hypothetical protein
MGALNIPSATAKQEQAKAIGEAVRLLHRAGWHEYAKQIANAARESGLCVDDGRRLVQSCVENQIQSYEAAREQADRCEGRYSVPRTSPPREEPFDVTYRCAKPEGHEGPHGR